MHVGIVLDACCAGIHLLPEVAQRLGFKPGDYFQVDHDERCTVIVRPLVGCRMNDGMRPNYVYLDQQSAYYLTTDVHEIVRLRPAAYPVDCP